MKRIILILAISIFVIVNTAADSQNLQKPVDFGVSFSPRYAQELGLDPRLTYQSILTDLSIKSVRLSALWDEIESEQDKFDFAELDWYINEATKHQAKVILAIGYKLPRWPECRAPEWFSRDRQLVMLKAVINHYEKNPTISVFQVENEPLLNYGLCPLPDREFLQKEVEFIRTRTQKPIIITDS
ncbi:MAG: beta-galactosidase, partial [Candidatus Daviesbacteria bacterium]|nr:beta-galactosidase [Candidatus Daviesbacteria bacterium]